LGYLSQGIRNLGVGDGGQPQDFWANRLIFLKNGFSDIQKIWGRVFFEKNWGILDIRSKNGGSDIQKMGANRSHPVFESKSLAKIGNFEKIFD